MTTQHHNKLLFFIVLVLIVVWFSPTANTEPRERLPITYSKGQLTLPSTPPKTLAVDVALDRSAWQQGMMFRKDWGDIEGMLFVFPDEEPRSFWMQNTYLPLDIIYLDSDARIVHIAANAKPLDTTGLPSGKPAQMVLEIAGGAAKRYGLREGDVIGIER